MAEENLQGMAEDLSSCSDKEVLAELSQCWPSYAMTAACKLLTQEKHQQLRQWMIELNEIGS
jgi:hypothetical protein